MSNIIVGTGGRGGAATAITVALILILMMASSPAAILSTTEAFAASKSSNKDCKDIQFLRFELDNTITIETSQDEYSVKIDYREAEASSGTEYIKNVAANDPRGRVLLPGGETITITLQTLAYLPEERSTAITLYNHKVSDCQILLGHVKDKDKMNLEILSIEQTRDSPIAKVTVRVPDASDVDKQFSKLDVFYEHGALEHQLDHYIISRVQVR